MTTVEHLSSQITQMEYRKLVLQGKMLELQSELSVLNVVLSERKSTLNDILFRKQAEERRKKLKRG